MKNNTFEEMYMQNDEYGNEDEKFSLKNYFTLIVLNVLLILGFLYFMSADMIIPHLVLEGTAIFIFVCTFAYCGKYNVPDEKLRYNIILFIKIIISAVILILIRNEITSQIFYNSIHNNKSLKISLITIGFIIDFFSELIILGLTALDIKILKSKGISVNKYRLFSFALNIFPISYALSTIYVIIMLILWI